MLPFNVSLFRRHLARVRFRAPDGGLVAFDDNGDPPPESVILSNYVYASCGIKILQMFYLFNRLSEYDVMNLVRDRNGGWRYVRVGRWRRGALQLRGGDAAAAR